MYIRKKKYPSGNFGIIVVEKVRGKMNELVTIGIAKTDDEIDALINYGLRDIKIQTGDTSNVPFHATVH